MIKYHKILPIMVGTLISFAHVETARATDYTSGFDNGNTTINDGDSISVVDTDGDAVTGVKLTNSSASFTIDGAATIDVSGEGDATGVYARGGSSLDLGSGTVIDVEGASQVHGLRIDDSATTVDADNLTINVSSSSAANSYGLRLSGGVDVALTGETTINVTNANTDGSSAALNGVYVFAGSALDIEKLTLGVENTSSPAVTVYQGSLTLGDGSSITSTGSTGLYAIGSASQGSTVSLNNASITVDDGYAVKADRYSVVDLGSGTTINSSSESAAIWATGSTTQVSGDHLTINNTAGAGIWAASGAEITIGAGSDITAASDNGISATSSSSVDFIGSSSERNTLTVYDGYAATAQGNDAVVNIENTDISIDNEEEGSVELGLFAYGNGVVNIENSSITVADDSELVYAVYAMAGGTVNLSEETEIYAGSNSKSALGTQSSDATINLTGQAIIEGNIFASGSGSLINIDVDSDSIITGYTTIDTVYTGASLDIELTDSTWNMTDNSQLSDLVLNDSTTNFTNADYATLSTDTLSGSDGLFNMRTDLAEQQGDLIVVDGVAQGIHQLNITNNGSSATDGTEVLTVVETGDNQADFSLTNEVEAGAYVYDLRESLTDSEALELYSTGEKTSTATSATSFLNIGYLTNYIENQTLLQRLGDVRNNEAVGLKNDGVWAKTFAGKLSDFSDSELEGFDMTYAGVQMGIDKHINVANGNLLVGVMAGFTNTDADYEEGYGDGRNYSAGLYGTYFLDNGVYVDSVLKYNSMRNHFNVKDTSGTSVKGTGKTDGISLSAEVGKRFWLSDDHQGIYLEPQVQLSYGYQSGDSIYSSNGLKVSLSDYNSTLGRVSGIVGYQLKGKNIVNVYFKTGVVREMSGGASYRFNNGEKNSYTFRSTWFDNGIGVNINLNKKHNIYAEADYSTGSFDNTSLNIGYRYNF